MSEKDPNGFSPRTPGSKLDHGKNRLGLVLGGFSNALLAVGEVGTYGAKKYTDNGWKHVPGWQGRYTDALLRHLFKQLAGEQYDEESRLPHLAHAAWNTLAVLELALKEKVDDEHTRKTESPREDEQGHPSTCGPSSLSAGGFNQQPYYKDAWEPRGADNSGICSTTAGCLSECREIASGE